MVRIDFKTQKISKDMVKEIEKIKIERIKLGIDTEFLSSARITARIVKEPEFKIIRDKIIRMPRNKDFDGGIK